MNRLIKAEWYKFIHSGACIRVLFIIYLVLFLFPLVQDFSFMDRTVSENLNVFATGMQLIVLMVLPAYITICTTFGYTNKTAYYEVMAGSKTGHIIGSKILVRGGVVGIGAFLATIGMGVVVAVKNGMGDTEYFGVRCILLCVVYLHVSIVAVLIGMAVKNIGAGIVSYLRFILLETAILLLMPILQLKEIVSEAGCDVIRELMVMIQMGEIFTGEVTRGLVMGVLASTVVEVVLWYSIVYYTMKKKLYK